MSAQNLPQPAKPNTPVLKEELFGRFLDLQEKELAARAQEFELRKQSEAHQFEFAKAALSAKVEDGKGERTHQQRKSLFVFGFILVIVIAILVFMAYALQSGNQQVAMEIIKAITFFLTGGAGGYAVGKSRHSAPTTPKG
jgi:hypothetical protein